jgi:hypothetical protein
MPHLTFVTAIDGPAIDVLIGLSAPKMRSLQNAGQPIPPPSQVRALLDTGTDVSAVSASCLASFGAIPENRVQTQTAGGVVMVDLYKVSLSIGAPGGKKGPMLVRSELEVTQLAHPLPGFDALIGLDVLADCLLIFDGPGRHFTLAF